MTIETSDRLVNVEKFQKLQRFSIRAIARIRSEMKLFTAITKMDSTPIGAMIIQPNSKLPLNTSENGKHSKFEYAGKVRVS